MVNNWLVAGASVLAVGAFCSDNEEDYSDESLLEYDNVCSDNTNDETMVDAIVKQGEGGWAVWVGGVLFTPSAPQRTVRGVLVKITAVYDTAISAIVGNKPEAQFSYNQPIALA